MPNNPYSQLYPYNVDTFRVVIIPPQTDFNLRTMFWTWDGYFMIGFTMYGLFMFIARVIILKEIRITQWYRVGRHFLGQTRAEHQRHRFNSVNFVKILYSFYLYIYYIVYMSIILKMLTNTLTYPSITYLNTANETKADIVLTNPFVQAYPYLNNLITDRLRKPLLLTTEQLQAKIREDRNVFFIVYNDHLVRVFLANYLPERKYGVVSESFGLNLYTYRTQPNSIFKARLNGFISSMMESGILKAHRGWSWTNVTKSLLLKVHSNEQQVVKYEDFVKIVIVYAFCLLAIFCVFLGEIFYANLGVLKGIIRRFLRRCMQCIRRNN